MWRLVAFQSFYCAFTRCGCLSREIIVVLHMICFLLLLLLLLLLFSFIILLCRMAVHCFIFVFSGKKGCLLLTKIRANTVNTCLLCEILKILIGNMLNSTKESPTHFLLFRSCASHLKWNGDLTFRTASSPHE